MFTAVKVILVVIAGLAAAYLLISYESGRGSSIPGGRLRLYCLQSWSAQCVVTVNQVYASVDEYLHTREMFDDFSAQKKIEFGYEWRNPDGSGGTNYNSFYDMYDGIDPEMSAELESLIGTDHLQMGIRDERHTMEWENMEEPGHPGYYEGRRRIPEI